MDGQHTAIYEQTWVSGELVTSQYVEEISTTSVTEVVERGTAVSYVEPDDKLVNVTTQSDGSGYLTFASGGTMTVSYTHLDVCKRQNLRCLRRYLVCLWNG